MLTNALSDSFIITCEHGGNRIPAQYRGLFLEKQALLNSHRAYDPGALDMARALAFAFNGPLVSSSISRLLIDLNRSIGHRHLFSAAMRGVPATVRDEIVAQYYWPYRAKVERLASETASAGRRVIHNSSHSFTPEKGGKVRRADVGLLYEPDRKGEAELCVRWRASVAARAH